MKVLTRGLGFSFLEVLITILILSILASIALPNMNDFIEKMAVENEASQVHRILLAARNSAINKEQTVIVCPLDDDGSCTSNWTNAISAFTDNNNDNSYQAANDELIKVKSATSGRQQIAFNTDKVMFDATGKRIDSQSRTFSICSAIKSQFNKGVTVSQLGRVYQSQDIDADGKDEDRLGNEISCS
ncbi:GspH/FimT family protein [Thalassotalea maritima]|uniref:GspH/FimT family protein n=1 Tax=Thalassotalea maritima TaxID=3242416 RepID=UPI0035273D9E